MGVTYFIYTLYMEIAICELDPPPPPQRILVLHMYLGQQRTHVLQ